MGQERDAWLALVACFVLSVGILVFSNQAKSHDWYPMECCSGLDCAPVEKVEMLAGPSMPA